MKRLAATLFVGFWGSVKGLVGFALVLGFVAWGPVVLNSVANRGTLDFDAFVPRSSVSVSQSGGLKVEGTPGQQAVVRTALDDLVWPVDTSGFTVVVTSPRNLPVGAAGMYVFPDNVIDISSSVVGDPDPQGAVHVLAHEMGHMFDSVYLDDAGRAEFLRLRGFPPDTDWRGDNAEWAARPQEDFAEVYAAFDAPSSGVPIATNAGRLNNAGAIRALIARYQTSGVRRTSLQLGTIAAVTRQTADMVQTDPAVSRGMILLAVVCAVFGATESIEDIPFKSRRRLRRVAARVVRRELHHHVA